MESLLYFALGNVILATVLAAVVMVVAPIFRRPGVRHALWLLVLLKLVTPPLLPLAITWPRTEESEPLPLETVQSPVILAPDPEPSELIPLLPEVPGERGRVSAPSGERGRVSAPSGERGRVSAPSGERGRVSAPSASLGALTQPRSPSDPPNLVDFWMPAVIAIWLGGALLWWSIAAVRLRKFQRFLRQAEPAPAEVQEQGHRLAALLRLRHCPPIVFVSAPLSPMLWALGLSPRLLVPAALWRKLTAEQQDTLLAHELAHLRRGDHWVRRLEFLVLGLYWWHPVVWWARRQLQQAEEECCDAVVIALLPDAASDYASALIETVAFLSQTRSAALLGASGAGHVPLLKRRLTMILSATSSYKPSRIAFWAILGLGALLLPLAPQAARTQAPEKPKPVELKTTIEESVKAQLKNIDMHMIDIKAKDCASCHQMPMAHGQDFQGKPKSWQQAHDEVSRLLDEIKVRRTQLQQTEDRLKRALESLKKLEPRAENAIYPQHWGNYFEPARQMSWNVTWAEALFERRTHDMGSVQHGSLVKTEFAMTNHGQRPVHITGLRTSAGCLKAITFDHELPPGKSGAIQVQLDTSKFSGSKTFQIHVQFDKPDRQEVVLEIRADSRTAAPAKPKSPERLQELEKKLDALRKEMDALRRDMRPDKPH